ncbi:MAG: hypothetical protein CVV44_12595 [Spirochaetae bacterium HGW-Spirochaetae-1]|jgi:hypothetical protein|nr:MAG: hypothetical protein CVV44_12595 [Spirochaetae bacterium HGW-Spirochaetae-1]
MLNIALFFNNSLEAIPFALTLINNKVRIIRDFRRLRFPDNIITLGYTDTIDSFRNLSIPFNSTQRRLEILYALTIYYSKGDQPKKWKFRKSEIIGKYIAPSVITNLKQYENSELSWSEFSKILFSQKTNLLNAVKNVYDQLLTEYTQNSLDKLAWLETEYFIDNYFLMNQYNGIMVDKNKIEKQLFDMNFQKYSALLYLEKNYNLDISSSYLSDEKIDELILSEYKDFEKTEEITSLIQVINTSDNRIESITTVKECRIDYANLIKHYSTDDIPYIYPQYDVIGSSSGRIFIASPGTQYLKKSKRDIFLAQNDHTLTYFDFRNYEPGIAAGLSNDKNFINYYNSGDMYSKIASEVYNEPERRKDVKISILMLLYGMSPESLHYYFKKNNNFNPDGVIHILNGFQQLQEWKKSILDDVLKKYTVVDKTYTRKFLPNNDWKIKTSAVNHIIQSTGSRILKRCIKEIINIEGIKILIPMHDALLCEIIDSRYVEIKEQVIRIMESIFTDEVMYATSRVIVTDFSTEKKFL